MINTFNIAVLLGFAITMILIFSEGSQFSANTVQVSGYEQNNDVYTKNSCGNGILPENIPCTNAENNAKGDKNIVDIEGIIFP
jgi:hypothetical protein